MAPTGVALIMVDGKASLYVGSPRMVEMAIGEKTTLEELGGARMHCEVSGCGDVLAEPLAPIAVTPPGQAGASQVIASVTAKM